MPQGDFTDGLLKDTLKNENTASSQKSASPKPKEQQPKMTESKQNKPTIGPLDMKKVN